MLLQTPFINIYREQCPNRKDLRWRSYALKSEMEELTIFVLIKQVFCKQEFALSDSYNNMTTELLILNIV